MKKSELRQIIREIIEEQAVDQFGGISGFSSNTDPQTLGNLAGSGGLQFQNQQGGDLTQTQSYQDFINANPGVEGQLGDAGTFNAGVWYNNFQSKVANAQNPCNFLANQSNKLALKYPSAGGKYKAQLYVKLTMMQFIAIPNGCGPLQALAGIPAPTLN